MIFREEIYAIVDKLIHGYEINNDEYICYFDFVQSLTGLTNQQDFLGKDKYPIRPGLINLIPHLEQDGFGYRIDEYGFYMTIFFDNGNSYHVFDCDYGLADSVAARIFDDKMITYKILKQQYYRTPKTYLLIRKESKYSNPHNSSEGAKEFTKNLSYPLIFKPFNGSLGRGVQKIFSKEQLIQVLQKFDAGEFGMQHYLVQEFAKGRDVRAVYLDGKILIAYERISPYVVGRGSHTVDELIDLCDYAHIKESASAYLQLQSIKLTDMLNTGDPLCLLPVNNVSQGGSVVPFEFDHDDEIFLDGISSLFGSRYFGIDIMTQGNLKDGTIIELNKMPGTLGANKVKIGFSQELGKKVWEEIKRKMRYIDY